MADHRKPTESFMGSIEPVRPGGYDDLKQRIADLEQRHEQDLKIIMGHNMANGELRRQISLLQGTIVRIAGRND